MISNRQLFLRHLAQTSESSLQFEIEKAEGIFFYDKKGKPYIRTKSGRKAGLNEFPGVPVPVKAYVHISPDDWNEMEGDK